MRITKCVVGVVAVIGLVLGAARVANAILITFEEGVGHNLEEINTQYQGVSFESATSGLSWLYIDATTGMYNVSSWPSGQSWGSGDYWINDLVSAWTTVSGDDGKIAFTAQDASYVQLNYSAATEFWLEAYNPSGALIDLDSGPANLRYTHNNPKGPGTLRVDAPSGETIAYVLVHDMGNYWTVDNVMTDASGIGGGLVPEPVTLVLLAGALLGLAVRRR